MDNVCNERRVLIKVIKNKYFLIFLITAIVFSLVWLFVDIPAAFFYSIVTAALLFFITFDPRIKKSDKKSRKSSDE